MGLGPYRKFVAALIAAIVIGLNQVLGVGDGETLFGVPVDAAADTIVALVGAAAVFWVRND